MAGAFVRSLLCKTLPISNPIPTRTRPFHLFSSSSSPLPFIRRLSAAPAPAAPAVSDAAVDPGRLRNVAVIAHVDHGKTTLMDRLLRQCGADIPHERALDSISLERERGIAIASKVERVVGMVEGAILVVDAGEGPLAQTKFVLAKALKYGLRPILLLNKVGRLSLLQRKNSLFLDQVQPIKENGTCQEIEADELLEADNIYSEHDQDFSKSNMEPVRISNGGTAGLSANLHV